MSASNEPSQFEEIIKPAREFLKMPDALCTIVADAIVDWGSKCSEKEWNGAPYEVQEVYNKLVTLGYKRR
jgi:hypothetical protein